MNLNKNYSYFKINQSNFLLKAKLCVMLLGILKIPKIEMTMMYTPHSSIVFMWKYWYNGIKGIQTCWRHRFYVLKRLTISSYLVIWTGVKRIIILVFYYIWLSLIIRWLDHWIIIVITRQLKLFGYKYDMIPLLGTSKSIKHITF